MKKIGMFSFVRRTLLFVCVLYLCLCINIQTAFSQSTTLKNLATESFKAMIQEAATTGPVALCNSLPVPSLLCNFVLKPVVDVLNRKYPNWHSNKEIALNAIDNDPDINKLISRRLSQLSLEHDEILKELRELGNNQYQIQTSLKSVLNKQDKLIRGQEEIKQMLKEQGITSGPRWNDAIIRDPKYAYSYNNRGIAKRKLGDYSGAIQDYNKAIELDPKYTYAYSNRGELKHALKDYRGAIQDYNKALELNPKFVPAYSNRGSAKVELKDYRGAIQDYNKAIELDPNYTNAYSNRGIAKSKLGDYSGAIHDYNKAIELDPKYTYAYFIRGITKDDLKDYRGAIQDYNKAIELDPNDADAYYNRGIAKSSLEQMNSACRDWSKAGELGDSDAYALIKEYCN